MEKPAPTAAVVPDWLKKLREGEEEKVTPTAAPAPQPVVKVTPPAPKPVSPEPKPAPKPTPPAPKPAPVVAEVEEAEVQVEEVLPGDADERLKLARLARDRGEIEEAVHTYDTLVSRGILLDKIIEDLEQTIKSYPSNFLLYQLMGDAMMKDGRLQSALDAYRQALAKL